MDNEDGENEDYENDDDENEDENSKTIKSGNIPSSTGEFHFIFHETDYNSTTCPTSHYCTAR
jgi:hypothetical protein